MANQYLPSECTAFCHALPILAERGPDQDPVHSFRATEAISTLLTISSKRLSTKIHGMSLILTHIYETSPQRTKHRPKVISSSEDPTKISKWLGKDHDDLINQSLKDCGILMQGRSVHTWRWELITPILRVSFIFFS